LVLLVFIRLPEEIPDTMGITQFYECLGIELIISLYSNRQTHLHDNQNKGIDDIFYPPSKLDNNERPDIMSGIISKMPDIAR
jgi:hypothetical protein